MIKNKTKILERFFSKVNKTKDCWFWNASTDTSGYGRFWDGNKLTGAHQFSYNLNVGEIENNLVVMHTCDNKKCVNPNHLKCGTQKENLQDMYRKGRNRSIETYFSGEEHCNAKLRNFEISKIKSLYSSGRYSQRSLAILFGVSKWCISGVVNNRTYKNAK